MGEGGRHEQEETRSSVSDARAQSAILWYDSQHSEHNVSASADLITDIASMEGSTLVHFSGTHAAICCLKWESVPPPCFHASCIIIWA